LVQANRVMGASVGAVIGPDGEWVMEYPEREVASAGKHGRGGGTQVLYKLEARTTYHTPNVLTHDEHFPLVLDHCWRNIPITLGATKWGTNIPIRSWAADAAKHGCIPYEAIEAHRWAFIAWLEAMKVGGSLCIETRLVEVKFSYSYSVEEVGVSAPLKEVSRNKPAFSPRPKVEEGEANELKAAAER
jgi:hypothetical protein